jgi:hypothetical protein
MTPFLAIRYHIVWNPFPLGISACDLVDFGQG